MKNWNVYVWTKTACGHADHSRNVDAESYEGALCAAMDQLGLAEARTTQIFEYVDCGPEDNATYFDNVSEGGHAFKKKWHW